MISDPGHAAVYTDFQGLARLRAEAGKNSPEAARETARQFEALFVQMMLKAMRDASPGGGLFDSDQVGLYRELYDRQLALHLVKDRGLGIAELLTAQLGDSRTHAPSAPAATPQSGVSAHAVSGPDATAPAATAAVPVPPAAGRAGPAAEATPQPGEGAGEWRPASPAEFIHDLWPHALEAAQTLGVTPEVLVAQAALETGWGQKMIRRPDGTNSFNLFGIKADSGWQGERVAVQTLEYEGGIADRRRAAFRAYDSMATAVADYADFVRGNPRYRPALERAADPHAYLQALGDAGYATDPHYVEKIRDIMSRGSFSREVGNLKVSGDVPLTRDTG